MVSAMFETKSGKTEESFARSGGSISLLQLAIQGDNLGDKLLHLNCMVKIIWSDLNVLDVYSRQKQAWVHQCMHSRVIIDI